MSSSGSLRDSYSSPQSSWSFRPSPLNQDASSSSVPKNSAEWSTRPSTNPVFDLAPSLPGYEQDGINIDVQVLIKGLFGSALISYTGTALVMPWEVAKLLLQIQWVPKYADNVGDVVTEVAEEELSEDSSDEAYFQDPTSSTPAISPPKPRPADEEGYVIRRSILEEETRPEYVMPITNTSGVWGMIKKITRWRNEGWLALWKGTLTSFITNSLSLAIQPLIQDVLLAMFSSPTHTSPSLLIPLASHFLTGIILSPLDLVRTRLIAQSSVPRHRTYSGPLNALGQLIRHEGGVRGLYFHPHLFVPAALDNFVRPFANLALPVLVASRLGISEENSRFLFGLTQLGVGCLALLITTPIETVRRRLQVQPRGTGTFKACVETRPRMYHGVVDAMWRITTEEKSEVTPVRKAKGKDKEGVPEDDGWVTWEGIGQLYHGLGMNTGALISVWVLSFFAPAEEAGWTEL